MIKKLYLPENFKSGQWSGGTTHEIAIYPDGADYLERDFIWRLSTADSDQDESSFTKLPDFDRILMVLEGNVVLAHGDQRSVDLGPLEQDTFDGAVKTKCFGNLKRDYNLIMRKGCQGRMEVIDAGSEAHPITLSPRKPAEEEVGGDSAALGFYCLEGYVLVSIDGNSEMVKEGQQLVLHCEPDEEVQVAVMGSGKCIFTEVIFEKQDLFFEEVVEEKASTNDFMMALKISMGNNKWNKVLKRASRSGELYDPALERKLRTIDKFMPTYIIWGVGTLLCLCSLQMGLSPGAVFGLFVAFSLVHLFLLRPLIYMIILPKPIAAHVKKSSELNKFEQELFEKQLDYDEHQEKLMYKYRDRSGEKYKSRKDFISKLNK